MYYLAVSGSRIYENWKLVFDTLEKESHHQDLFVKVGDCPTGADLFVTQWCYAMQMFDPFMYDTREHQPTAKIFVADWSKHGKAAGPIRNHEMIDWERTDKLIAFPMPASKGTWECCEYTHSKEIPIEFPELVSGNYVDKLVRSRAAEYEQEQSKGNSTGNSHS